MTPRPREGGFTLVEMLLALSLVGLLLLTAFGGLRIGLASWRQGEAKAEAQQHARSLTQVLERSLAGAYPYLVLRPVTGGTGPGPTTVTTGPTGAPLLVYFEGDAEHVGFVTISPPLPPSGPIAFTAVTLGMAGGQNPGLAVRQKVMPNEDPFEAGLTPVLVDGSVTQARFRYLGDDWQEQWEPTAQRPMPTAVEITLTTRPTRPGGAPVEHPPLVVPLRTAALQ